MVRASVGQGVPLTLSISPVQCSVLPSLLAASELKYLSPLLISKRVRLLPARAHVMCSRPTAFVMCRGPTAFSSTSGCRK
eukprot:scaffold321828_cov31-Tisochrysis_lutea.AAC.1